ncbi:MAG TPA: hypothetical protein VGJ26_14385 [Pirellulales bacterium]|jgi:hypothetical protein
MLVKLLRLIYIAIATTVGGILGVGCLGSFILVKLHGYDHGDGESAESNIMGGVIGAIAGAAWVWYQLDWPSKPPEPPENSSD